MNPNSEVYAHPRYYALGYRWNTEAECAFIESCLKAYAKPGAGKRLLDLGCGSGRHLIELAKRGYDVAGIDRSEAMVDFLQEEAARENVKVDASVGDLRHLSLSGTYDAAFCLMDTFRFLLTNDEITAHLRTVAQHLSPGGLYITDFWVPRQWDMIANEIHQWEQTEGDTTVKVFYVQHPDSVDPISQTFEDELVFEVQEGDQAQTIQGGRTRTRLILPQEFRALVTGSRAFEVLSQHGEFDLEKPFDGDTLSWRMVSVLRKQ